MSVRDFENTRWRKDDQKPVFRHWAALALVDRGPVLDIGCGDGLMLDMLAKRGVRGEGIDVSEEAVQKCGSRGVKAAQWDFTAALLPYGDNEFATSLLMDVLEHVYAPEKLLAETLRVAAECIISVPNFNSLPARIQVLFGKIPENNTPGKGHVYWFNRDTLLGLVARMGYRIVAEKTNTFWEHVPVLGVLIRRLVQWFPNVFALSFVVKIRLKEAR